MTFPDLRLIERSGRPNDALACLPGDCAVPAEFEVPIIPVDVSVLMQSAEAVLRAEPRTALLERLEDPERLVFVQRSRLFRFPDTVCIQGVAHEDGASAIIYSRSNYGFWDTGLITVSGISVRTAAGYGDGWPGCRRRWLLPVPVRYRRPPSSLRACVRRYRTLSHRYSRRATGGYDPTAQAAPA